MAYVCYLIGIVLFLIGGWWTLEVLTTAASTIPSGGAIGGGVALGVIIAGAPGFSVFLSSFIFFALGAGLDSLRQIAKNTRRMERAMSDWLNQADREPDLSRSRR